MRQDASPPVPPSLLVSTDERSCISGQASFSLDRSAAAKRCNCFPMVCHSLLPLFLRDASFVFKHFPPLCPKMGGGVYTLPRTFRFRRPLFAADPFRSGRQCWGAISSLWALRSGASARGAAFGRA